MNLIQPRILAVCVAVVAALTMISAASAHPHIAENANGDNGKGDPGTVALANGESHSTPIFNEDGTVTVCGAPTEHPAFYGIQTAHHGPDHEPGRADGCLVTTVDDNNPGIGEWFGHFARNEPPRRPDAASGARSG